MSLTFLRPTGLLRRALLAAGRRLAERGRLDDAALVFALGEDEIVRALGGDDTLGEVAAARGARLLAAEAAGAPATLGDDEGPPPNPDLFPRAMAAMMRAAMLPFELETATLSRAAEPADVVDRAGPVSEWTATGVGIGSGRRTGRACVAVSADDAVDRLRLGDVLVTTFTTPAFEAILPIAAAVVTDRGGSMSHTAPACREYGIPAVVGAVGATTNIADGSMITVDASTGQVIASAPKLRLFG